jgi:glucan 1,3-beta-glucosidase
MIHVLHVLLSAILSLPMCPTNIVGIELLNEPSPPSSLSHKVLKEWYTSAIKELHALDPSMLIYVGDCWCMDEYAEFIESLLGVNREDGNALVVLDHHLYRCFTALDIQTPSDSHAQALSDGGAPTSQTLTHAAEKIGCARYGGGLVIGEWSGALNPGSLTRSPGERSRYVDTQLGLYEKTCLGWFFWTFHKQWEGDEG